MNDRLTVLMAAMAATLILSSSAALGADNWADLLGAETLREFVAGAVTVPFGVERRFETDIDDGGEVDEWRLHVGTGARIMLSRQWQGALNVNYMYNRYDFSGSTGFGGLDPWEDLNFTTVTAPLTYILSKRWHFGVSPIFRISAESGADIGLFDDATARQAWGERIYSSHVGRAFPTRVF